MIPRLVDPGAGTPDAGETPAEYETKYVFASARGHAIRRWLVSCAPPHASYPASIVSSIYYDTRGWRSLAEKLDSDLFKLKVRLRWYADPGASRPHDTVFLEAKFKRGRQRGKVRVPLGIPARDLSRSTVPLPDVGPLLSRHGVVPPGLLLPVFRIDYTRRRFREPGTGANLCLDHGIRAARIGRGLPHDDPRSLPVGVFEYKGRSPELSPWLRPLVALGCRKRSFSKYAACFERLFAAAG